MGNIPICQRQEDLYFSHDSSNDFSSQLVKHLRDEVGVYMPPFWYNKHLASILHIGRSIEIEYRREVLVHDDGNLFSCDWFPANELPYLDDEKPAKKENSTSSSIVVIVPALGGNSGDGYIRSLVQQLADHGYTCAVLNVRGTLQPLTKPSPFNVTDCSDLRILIEHIVHTFQYGHLYCAGFSMGANWVSRLLMEQGKNTPITAAMSVCNSFDYQKGLETMETAGPFGQVYSKGFVELFKRYFHRNREALQPVFNLQVLNEVTLMSQLDKICCQTLYGYENVEHFWKEASPISRLRDISVPFLALQALDDPAFVDSVRDIVPLHQMLENPNIIYMESSRGGHFGYVEGELGRAYTYPSKVATAFFDYVRHKR